MKLDAEYERKLAYIASRQDRFLVPRDDASKRTAFLRSTARDRERAGESWCGWVTGP
jgi:hypothetical protein